MVGEAEKGDYILITYKDGEITRRAKGTFQHEDETSVTILLNNYSVRIFKNCIFKIEKPRNHRRGI